MFLHDNENLIKVESLSDTLSLYFNNKYFGGFQVPFVSKKLWLVAVTTVRQRLPGLYGTKR